MVSNLILFEYDSMSICVMTVDEEKKENEKKMKWNRIVNSVEWTWIDLMNSVENLERLRE